MKKGFVALMSMLIISMTLSALFIVAQLPILERNELVTEREKYAQSRRVIESCMEYTLMRLIVDPAYQGHECGVDSIAKEGSHYRVILSNPRVTLVLEADLGDVVHPFIISLSFL